MLMLCSGGLLWAGTWLSVVLFVEQNIEKVDIEQTGSELTHSAHATTLDRGSLLFRPRKPQLGLVFAMTPPSLPPLAANTSSGPAKAAASIADAAGAEGYLE